MVSEICQLHRVSLVLHIHSLIYLLLQIRPCQGMGATTGLPFSVPLGTSFTKAHTLWMQSENEMFQVDIREWVDDGRSQCMGGVRYTFKTPNALIWSFNSGPDPVIGSDCALHLRNDGVLAFEYTPQVPNNGSSPLRAVSWQTQTAGLGVRNLSLLNDGNLVLVDAGGRIAWQSFTVLHDLFLIPAGLKFFGNMTLYDRVALYADFSTPGCYALSMGSEGSLIMFTRANKYVYHTIGVTNRSENYSVVNDTVAEYIVIRQNISFYDSRGVLLGNIPHNVLNDDPLPNATDLIGSALFKDGNLMINRPSDQNHNHHLWYYNSSINNFCAFPLVCGEYGLCNELSRSCSCPPGFRISYEMPACTATDDATQKCSCPNRYKMPTFNSTCVPADSSSSFVPISVTFPPQPSSLTVASQAECSDLCSRNSSCKAALFDSSTSSCALFPILYTMTVPSENNSSQIMLLKIIAPETSPSTSITGIIIGCVVAGLVTFVIVGILTIWRRRRLQDRHSLLAQERFLQELSKLPPRFSYKELEIATDNFSKKLGVGGFGSVYEGLLRSPAGIMKVAVKKLDQAGLATNSTMDEQFKAEVATIGSVSHVNLVSLKGFCMEKSARLLVFEFMPKGSLDRWLSEARGNYRHQYTHSSESRRQNCESPSDQTLLRKVLNWELRCRIALDTARGLEYLHHQSAEHIVHCDVKPANILLDNEFHAKVGDFGLAKLMASDRQSFAMTTLKGTRGYVAPEWLQQANITAKSDVFSYGVVLLELLTGRKCISAEHDHLATWVMKTIANESGVKANLNTATTLDLESLDTSFLQQKIMDHNLSDEDVPADVFKRMLIVALACVQSDPGERPSMAFVVQMLEDIMGVSYAQPSVRLANYSAHMATISSSDFSSFSVSRSAISSVGQRSMDAR
ncbi:hypothetical protein KP509_11G047700 [Ceratopteris richardii]|nr:hypothetical protein KP509_11G047700 [Ceratopteris richardii]